MKKIVIFACIVLVFTACQKEILDKTDHSGVTDEAVWNNESTANLYLNRTYDLIMPTWPSMRAGTTLPTALHDGSDESNSGDTKVLYGQLTVENVTDFGSGTSNNPWISLKRVNLILSKVEQGSLSADVKNKIKGQAYFLRAWIYFQMVKLYGGVPIITSVQDWMTDDLAVPRNTTKDCINFITANLDSSATALSSSTRLLAAQASGDRGRITADAALAVKGRVLLFWASPQFNPVTTVADYPSTYDATRWERAYQANKAAYTQLVADNYALVSNYANVLTDKTAANTEMILIRSFDGSNVSETFDKSVRPFSEGGSGTSYNPTWELVKAYPMSNGKASTAENGFDIQYYWKNRDPRFAATIAYNGSTWELSSKTGRRQWTYVNITEDKSAQTKTGFYCKKGVNTSILAANTQYGKTDWVEMRFAEVILNLAECAANTNRISEAYTLVELIRKRAGITNSNGHYGLDVNMDAANMVTAIINERRIEFAFEGKRYDDLRRTRLFSTMVNYQRYGLLINVKSAALLKALETANSDGVLLRDRIDINGADYATYFTAVETSLDVTYPFAFKENYYFYGIPTANILKDKNFFQTLGWGTPAFNPLAE